MSGEMVIGDDGWTEIVGEQTRGGTAPMNTLSPVLGANPGLAFEILGELMEKSPAFAQYAQKRAAASRPMTHKIPLQKARDWQIDFGPVSGAAKKMKKRLTGLAARLYFPPPRDPCGTSAV